MKKAFVLPLVALLCFSPTSELSAKKATQDSYRISEPLFDTKTVPPDLLPYLEPEPAIGEADTFHLAWYGFDSNGPDEMGWTRFDHSDQLKTFWHVADATELDGGVGSAVIPPPSPGDQLLPLSGAQSMWCGQDASTEVAFCGWAALPGYGNNWDQTLTAGPLACDSVTFSYTIYWDSEPGYDWTTLEWSADGATWNEIAAVGGGFNATAGRYDRHGPYPGDGGYNAYLVESFTLGPSLAGGNFTGEWHIRFRSRSDGAFSGQDGLRPTDGMILLDDIEVVRRNLDGSPIETYFEDFEAPGSSPGDHSAGIWKGEAYPGYDHYQQLYPGITVLQEDLCLRVIDNVWGFFDDVPSPCGVHPEQGVVPYKNSRDQYMWNEIWSPLIPNTGEGDLYLLGFKAYSDLTLDDLVAYTWRIRTYPNGENSCPTEWTSDLNLYLDAGRPKQWHRYDNMNLPMFNVSPYVGSTPTHFQVALGAFDFCPFSGSCFLAYVKCHTQAPLFDDVQLLRVNLTGPQYANLHIYEFFQDNFAEDGTLTGHARADIALDIQSGSSLAILPGDSAIVTVSGITTDPITSVGPSVYAYVSLNPSGQPGKSAANLEAPDTRAAVGKRFPFVETVVHNGVTWYAFRMDSVFASTGDVWPDKYCFDFNDWVFTPCDTVWYVICAKDDMGNENYLSRRGKGSREFFWTRYRSQAFNSPMEFTILPATGWKNGGDILYVDYADGSMSQLFYDTTFGALAIDHLIDRYDATPGRGNGLGSRVKNVQTQIGDCYRKIIWDAGNADVPIGDGTLWEKSDDMGVLYTFLDTHPDNPGVLLLGSNFAEAWAANMTGQSAADMKSIYLNHTLLSDDHHAAGESTTPLLTAVDPGFIHLGVPDELYIYGGCPVRRDFDLIEPAGACVATFRSNGGTGPAYGVWQTTPNSTLPATYARAMMFGFGLFDVRDDIVQYPVDRMELIRDAIINLQNIVPQPVAVPEAAPVFENRLANNYPNPFNPVTTIHYAIKDAGPVTLRIYNAAGQLVRTLVDEAQTPREGGFTVEWDGKSDAGQSVSSGVYFYKLTAKDFGATKKMVMLK